MPDTQTQTPDKFNFFRNVLETVEVWKDLSDGKWELTDIDSLSRLIYTLSELPIIDSIFPQGVDNVLKFISDNTTHVESSLQFMSAFYNISQGKDRFKNLALMTYHSAGFWTAIKVLGSWFGEQFTESDVNTSLVEPNYTLPSVV